MNNLFSFEAPHLLGGAYRLDSALGASLWLAMHSLPHRCLPVADLESRFLLPLANAQYVLVREKGGAAAPEDARCLLTYAQVSDAAHARLLCNRHARLAVREWCSGEHTWLMDWVNPFDAPESLLQSVLGLMGERSTHRSARMDWMERCVEGQEGPVICCEGMHRISTL